MEKCFQIFDIDASLVKFLFVSPQIFRQDQERLGTPSEFWESTWKIWHGVHGLQHEQKGKEPTTFSSIHPLPQFLLYWYISVILWRLQEENQTAVDAAPKKRTCKLDVKVQSLLELICDIKAMEECVLEMKFDTRKAPLGRSR